MGEKETKSPFRDTCSVTGSDFVGVGTARTQPRITEGVIMRRYVWQDLGEAVANGLSVSIRSELEDIADPKERYTRLAYIVSELVVRLGMRQRQEIADEVAI